MSPTSTGLGTGTSGTGPARSRAPAEEADGVGGPTAVLEGLGVRPGDADLTVVQFSTAFCGPCRTTRARLQHLGATRPGLAHVHVDAESHLDAVRALDVRRTPTLFYLDREGRLLGRSSGAPRPEELTALVDAHTGPRS
jgi:thiol-disulfide isomerase/thioredoxin